MQTVSGQRLLTGKTCLSKMSHAKACGRPLQLAVDIECKIVMHHYVIACAICTLTPICKAR